ncbi:MAG TPA: hypothetical protein VMW78_01850 [Anaerolineae bacterium]|nr:hypothetical protein [Anaerolineae bacterium]
MKQKNAMFSLITNMKMKHHEPVEKDTSFQEESLEKGVGQNLLFVATCFLLVGLAVPLLLVFLIKSPQPEQHLLIFNISYYKLVFIFFLSAVVMIHTSLFFLRANLLTIFLVFVLSLFCCFPLIMGFRNNLTLHQAIIDIPFFANWPFFLKPAYIMIEFLIPAGIVIYLLLQIRSVFSKKSHTKAFFCAAVYLSIAASLGFAALIQADQPNIVTALARKKVESAPKNSGSVTSKLPVPQIQNNINPESLNDINPGGPAPESRLSTTGQDPASSKMSAIEVEQEMWLLFDKVDRAIVELGEMKILMVEQQQNLQKNEANAAVQKKEISESRPTIAIKEPLIDRAAIVKMQQDVRLLTDKTDRILDALGRMANLLSEPRKNPQKNEGMVEGKAMVEEKETDNAQPN